MPKCYVCNTDFPERGVDLTNLNQMYFCSSTCHEEYAGITASDEYQYPHDTDCDY